MAIAVAFNRVCTFPAAELGGPHKLVAFRGKELVSLDGPRDEGGVVLAELVEGSDGRHYWQRPNGEKWLYQEVQLYGMGMP